MVPGNNTSSLFRRLLFLVCSIVLITISPYTLASSDKAISPPPSVDLEYVVRANYSAMSIGGSSAIHWRHTADRYAIKTGARANLLGNLINTTSTGNITPEGLKPEKYTEKRRNRDATQTLFDHGKRTLTFSNAPHPFPFGEGIQDRDSIVWQLVSLVRARPEILSEGKKLTFMVSGRKRIDQWVFQVIGEETIQTMLGEVKAIHLFRQDKKGKTTEVWLAPEMEWYPVRLIFFDNKDLRLEQIIQKITPAADNLN
ncbi:MAG: DUF3108 domain-containing protein [Burkholderiaceae bacterium]|nr:DUF3108 domain-containing protein [Burkholderiaceae bacterium]